MKYSNLSVASKLVRSEHLSSIRTLLRGGSDISLKTDLATEVPNWLASVDAASITERKFPAKEVLENSLYYPAARLDGRPVQFLGGFIHSFIYADYSVSQAHFEQHVRERGFRGYRLAGKKDLTPADLLLTEVNVEANASPEEWNLQPPPNTRQRVLQRRPQPAEFSPLGRWMLSGTDEFRRDIENARRAVARHSDTIGFGTWYIFDRDDEIDEGHGPSRFSLVYFGQEGIASYQHLYCRNNIAPLALAIIQPGHNLGGNFTNFCDPDGLFARSVLGCG